MAVPYRYLNEIAIADAAFEALGRTREEMFIAAGEALVNVTVEDPGSIHPQRRLAFRLCAETIERLLFDFLQEFIYLKDASRLLVRVPSVVILGGDPRLDLIAEAAGETIDPARHRLAADIKAVTLHRFRVVETPQGWQATVVLDI